MNIIIDECVPSIVKRGLPHRMIRTVQEMGWSGIKNGDLLRLVVTEFDVFITSDKNLRHQQNLTSFDLTVILCQVIRFHSSRRCFPSWTKHYHRSARAALLKSE